MSVSATKTKGNGVMRPATADLPPQLRRLADIPVVFKGIIDGESGAGKTTLAATAPGPRLWLNAEDGLNILTDAQRETDLVWDCRDWQDCEDAIQWLEDGGDQQFPTVIVDTVSECGQLKKKEMLTRPSVGGPSRVHPMTLGQAEYDYFAEEMLAWMRRFRALRCNVIFTAQLRDIEIDDLIDGEFRHIKERYPSLGEGKKGSYAVLPLFDFVAYLEVIILKNENGEPEPVRKLTLQPVGKAKVKIRTPGGAPAPLGFLDPDMTNIFHLMRTGTYEIEEAK